MAHAAYTDPYTEPSTGRTWTRKKSARRPSWTEVDARDGKLGKTTYVAHAAYTDPYTDPVNGLYVDTGKKCPTAVMDGS